MQENWHLKRLGDLPETPTSLIIQVKRMVLIRCPYRKSNPDVLMMQTPEVRHGHDAANRLNCTRHWCILVQR